MVLSMEKTLRSREDWIQAAVSALAERGEVGLAVEELARTLGVTKGSFYWHFKDRAALVTATLETFERMGADEPIHQLRQVPNGRERLEQLFALAFRHTRELRAEQALFAMKDPRVRAVIQRVHEKRRAFLLSTYRSLGLSRAEAQRWAATAYATFVGAAGLALQAPWNDERSLRAWVEHIATVLIPPALEA
jgi:AcrR family transcriptional regulator